MSSRPEVLAHSDIAVIADSASIDVIEDLHVAFHHVITRMFSNLLTVHLEENSHV
jgi:hypothetical protein